jgi:hypothetical protein
VWLGKPIDTSDMYLATWLGYTGGFNPTSSWQKIEPYTAHKQSGVVAATFMCNTRKTGAHKGAAKARRQVAKAGVLDTEDADKGEGPSSRPLQECMGATLPYSDDYTNIAPPLTPHCKTRIVS